MSAILGLNVFHADSAACILIDGKVAAAVAEERLGRRAKHFAGFPDEAIRRVLQMSGLELKDIEYVAVGHDQNANLTSKAAYALSHPRRSAKSIISHFSRRTKFAGVKEMVAETCQCDVGELKFEVVPVEHHVAHLASSFYASPFEEAAGFSYDAAGDFVSAIYARCHGCDLKILKRVFLPHSLGAFYTAICQFIGFGLYGEEYKVMGLAAYGQPVYLKEMAEFIRYSGDGQYLVDPQAVHQLQGVELDACATEKGEIVMPPLYGPPLLERFGAPRAREAPLDSRENNLAASCQAHFENIAIECIRWLQAQTKLTDVITAGGCALNGVCNARILRDTPFRRSYTHGAAGDDGTAVGAALYVWHQVLKKPRGEAVDALYLGPEYSASEMQASLEKASLRFKSFARGELLEQTARHLAAGHVLGWYQGRSEWGPRALGNRSILAHPGWPGMKDLINQKIKRREAFRPFAPSILAEDVGAYFEQEIESPFMMHVVKIRPEKRTELAAVCHADQTGRLHTVRRPQNELYYDLIKRFALLSGTPVVLNTSFNENEPIVDTPDQAVACFQRNDVDVLCLGPFVVVKAGKELESPA